MATEDAFTPRLGKIRDRGAAGGARLRKRVATTAKQLSRTGSKSRFKGVRIGRGKTSAMQSQYLVQRYTGQKMRRVIVKAHIAKPGKVVGAGVFSRHLNYLQRDGVERDGSGGELYTREGKTIDGDAFAARSKHDRHQFRFIVSPEDADQIGNLKTYTRELMEIMERDLGTKIDWVAVDHHNTGRSHTHIIVRGKDAAGRDLIIAPDYWSRGFRERASLLATKRLGPRRALEIMRQQRREVEQDRFTGIDRQLLSLEQDRRVEIPTATTTKDRFARDLQLQRLQHLKSLRLAEQEGPGIWQMQPQWNETLRAMGQRGDIIKAIAAGLEPGRVPEQLRFFNERAANAPPLVGTVYRYGPSDELRDTRYLLVRDFEGNIWHAEAGMLKDGALPPRGAIVELNSARAELRQSDRTIAGIAARSAGYYSEILHSQADPSSSPAYRLAHKRRLEALRRAGVVERLSDGRWKIDDGFLGRVQKLEAARNIPQIETRSWLPLKQQVEAAGATWLDGVDEAVIAKSKDETLKQAKIRRVQYLRDRGILSAGETRISEQQRAQLNASELDQSKLNYAKLSGQLPASLNPGSSFEGKFVDTMDLAQRRFAVIAKSKEFALVPWRNEMEQYRGQNLIVRTRGNSVSWSFPQGRKRGISR